VDLATWLHGLGMPRCERALRDNSINSAVLPKQNLENFDASIHRKLLVTPAALCSAASSVLLSETGEVGDVSTVDSPAANSDILRFRRFKPVAHCARSGGFALPAWPEQTRPELSKGPKQMPLLRFPLKALDWLD
jgi:hypothetical protein